MCHRYRDSTLWNMINYGEARDPLVSPVDEAFSNQENVATEATSHYHDESDYSSAETEESFEESKPLMQDPKEEMSEYIDEKAAFKDLEANKATPNEGRGIKRCRYPEMGSIAKVLGSACIFWMVFSLYSINPFAWLKCNTGNEMNPYVTSVDAIVESMNGEKIKHPSSIYRNLMDITINTIPSTGDDGENGNGNGDGDANKAKEIQEISNPFVPSPRYGKPIYKTNLIKHSFGNSYGHPKISKFTIPKNVTFNAVVLELLTEVDGVQYDRLANVFVNGVQIWRTSTIEPSGKKVFSIVNKDVSKYAKLFEGHDNEILFELNNIVNDKYTGALNVTLDATFFHFDPHHPHHHSNHSEVQHAKEHESNHEIAKEIFEKNNKEYESDSDSDSDSDNEEEEEGKRQESYKTREGNFKKMLGRKGGVNHREEKSKKGCAGNREEKKFHNSEHRNDKDGKDDKDDKDGKDDKKHKKPPHHGKPPHDKPGHHHPPPPPPPHHKAAHLFQINKPADSIHALTSTSKDEAPVEYLSSNRLKVKLPTVSKNTTRLQLSVFASGNAAEEFWYQNVIDSFKDIFEEEGNEFIGKGPLRFVNVYFNGRKIASQTPDPVIFTGGISPALWSPIVSISAFDVPAIDFDVTPLLPFLWEHQSVGDEYIEIEISNGLGEVGIDNTTAVNQNWITSANLLGYEHPFVKDTSGVLVNIDQRDRASVYPIAVPFTHSFQQIANGIFSAELVSDLSFTLKNNKTLNTTFSSFSKGEISNIQHYASSGDIQRLVHVGHSSSLILIQDKDIPEHHAGNDTDGETHHKKKPENIIHSIDTSISYPLVLNTNTVKKDYGSEGEYDIEYDVSIVNARDLEMKFDDHFGKIKVKSAQNGTSTFTLSNKGNHGYGSLTAKFFEKIDFGKHFHKGFFRRADAINGTIVHEDLKFRPDPEDHEHKHGKHKEHRKHKGEKGDESEKFEKFAKGNKMHKMHNMDDEHKMHKDHKDHKDHKMHKMHEMDDEHKVRKSHKDGKMHRMNKGHMGHKGHKSHERDGDLRDEKMSMATSLLYTLKSLGKGCAQRAKGAADLINSRFWKFENPRQQAQKLLKTFSKDVREGFDHKFIEKKMVKAGIHMNL